MELNEFEYQMLDAILESFGSGDELTRAQVVDLFNGDETFAASMISVLASEGLVVERGLNAGEALPEVRPKGPGAATFLMNGGFTAKVTGQTAPSWPAWTEETLLKKNTELQ